MQSTHSAGGSSAGDSNKIQSAPLSGNDDTIAVPQGATDERYDTGGSKVSQAEEFQNSEHERGGPSLGNMEEPLDTKNAVNPSPEPGWEQRGPREAQAHAETKQSTNQGSNEDRSVAPHAEDMR